MSLMQIIKEDKYVYISLLLFSFISMLFGTNFSPLYLYNQGSDQYVYYIMGKGWMNGYILYKDLFDHKGPLLFLIFGIGYLLSNESFLGLYIIESISFSLVLYFVYKIANLFVNRQYSYITALLFSIIVFSIYSFGASPEEFMLLCQSIGLYLILKHFLDPGNTRNRFYLFIQGILIGCVALIKINIIIFWFFPLLAIFIYTIRYNGLKNAFINILMVIIGLFVVIAPFIAYFYCVGALDDFCEAYIRFNILYSSNSLGSGSIFSIVKSMFLTTPFIFLLIALGVSYFTFTKTIPNIIFRYSLPLMLISAIYFIFKSAMITYYTISISILAVLGIIPLFRLFEKRYKVINPIYILSIAIVCFISTLFFKRKSIREYNTITPQIELANYMIEDSGNKVPDLLNITLDEGYYFLTKSMPKSKYFYMPAIQLEVYPQIVNYNKNLLESDDAPLYVTYKRCVFVAVESEENPYQDVIDKRYNTEKVITNYNSWPATQYILYKLKE